MAAGDVDLNLLRVLDALLETSSVSQAAARLHLSPPAVSRALGRLRRSIDDPLFVQVGRHLVPTARADALRADVRVALDAASAMLTPAPPLELRDLTRVFSITADDAIVAAIGVALIVRLVEQAPGVDICFLPDTDEFELLSSGAVDLDLGVAHQAAHLESEIVFVDRFVAAARTGHELGQGSFDLAAYAAAHHVSVSKHGRTKGPVDEQLALVGLSRDRIVTVPSFVLAAHIVATTDLVALMPDSVVELFAASLPIAAVDIPLDLPPLPICQTWHARFSDDAAHRWLRDQVRSVAREVGFASVRSAEEFSRDAK